MKLTPSRKVSGWCVAIALMALAGRLAIAAFKVSWLAAYFLTTSRLDALVIGALTAILVRQRPEWLRTWIKIAGWTMLSILSAIAVWRRGLFYDDWPMRTFGYTLFAIMFASLVWTAGNTQGRVSRFLSNPFLVVFGKYSYGLYIFHMLVLTVCERWLGPRLFPLAGWKGDAPLPLFVTAMSANFAIAYLSWRFYERPFLSLKSRFASSATPVSRATEA